MASPLLAYYNGRIKATDMRTVSIVNGRPVPTEAPFMSLSVISSVCNIRALQAALNRFLLSLNEGRMLPGASGDQFYYRGFALQKAPSRQWQLAW